MFGKVLQWFDYSSDFSNSLISYFKKIHDHEATYHLLSTFDFVLWIRTSAPVLVYFRWVVCGHGKASVHVIHWIALFFKEEGKHPSLHFDHRCLSCLRLKGGLFIGVVSRAVTFLETELWLPGAGTRGNGELVFNGAELQFCKMKRVLEAEAKVAAHARWCAPKISNRRRNEVTGLASGKHQSDSAHWKRFRAWASRVATNCTPRTKLNETEWNRRLSWKTKLFPLAYGAMLYLPRCKGCWPTLALNCGSVSVSLCSPGWSAVARSQLTTTSSSPD
ncbi:hypothetical protein AAY473_016093 [Plecturocebus cupreus]